MHESAKVVNVTLSYLPAGDKEDVLRGLKASSAPYGKIIDLGIFVDKTTRVFRGRGYAVLDIGSEESNQFQPLTHVINWFEDSDIFRATWKNMPTWCRYCHQEGHAIAECEQAKAGIVCFYCHQRGHRARECPDKQKSQNPSKRPRTVDPTPPSEELLKSKHAPAVQISETKATVTEVTSTTSVKPVTELPERMEENLVDSSGEEDSDYVPPSEDSDEELLKVDDTDEDMEAGIVDAVMEAGIVDEVMDEIQDLREEQKEHDSQALSSTQNVDPTNR